MFSRRFPDNGQKQECKLLHPVQCQPMHQPQQCRQLLLSGQYYHRHARNESHLPAVYGLPVFCFGKITFPSRYKFTRRRNSVSPPCEGTRTALICSPGSVTRPMRGEHCILNNIVFIGHTASLGHALMRRANNSQKVLTRKPPSYHVRRCFKSCNNECKINRISIHAGLISRAMIRGGLKTAVSNLPYLLPW